MRERRREIEEVLDRIEKCTCETDLIKLWRELDHLITRFCNRKISELVKTIYGKDVYKKLDEIITEAQKIKED